MDHRPAGQISDEQKWCPPHPPALKNALTNGADFLKFISKGKACKRRVLVASWLPMLNLQGPLLMKPAANLLR